MNGLLESILIFFLLTAIVTLGSGRIVSCIRLVAAQGAILGLLPLVAHDSISMRLWFLAITTFSIKGVLLPWLLMKARSQANVPREVEPFVGFGTSILVGLAMLAISFWIGITFTFATAPNFTAVHADFILWNLIRIVLNHKSSQSHHAGAWLSHFREWDLCLLA